MERETLCCVVTGANGYVGSTIAAYLRAQGVQVIAFNRRGREQPEADLVVPYRLGEEVPATAFVGVDALIHCAYDFRAATWSDIKRTNVDGTLRLFASAHAAGVRKIIFLSTLSAFEGCRSVYGQAKLAVERDAQHYGVVSVRPGLVFEEGRPKGMVGALGRVVELSPIVPLIGGGEQVLYPCHAEDLARLVLYLCTTTRQISKPVTAGSSAGLTFKQILARMAAAKGRRIVFVPVPYAFVVAALRLAERLGLKTRLRSDSLASLMNQNPHVDFSELDATGLTFRDFILLADAR